ncbi:DUF2892 domain-containing protein [Thiomicrorhabdus sp. 6S3-12]|uniref:YgaP family membrane protein n=1 Tax=Thiomicrorhabdus sp. 6S3-12 TaxID=2819681 RepID=UPI001AAC6D5B|nr:DUF2892 domain-containing protein [Thiomicrorhabdus sp. 6S3-12]MBO1923050.1 DUF2892 domain-containing protein [Thiomicrorhabdus sp. 6S3-12]
MNVGLVDRIIRILIGALLIALSYFDIIGAWGYIGVIPLVTGLIKWCPLYTLLGIQTCPVHANIKYDK